MELTLSRVDYLHIGSSFPDCVRILPTFAEDKSQHKLVAVNRSGAIQVLSWHKNEPVIHSKVKLNAPVSAIQLGGALGSSKDKIFVASGNTVKGLTKKGKMFLEFDTNLAETINSMYVSGEYLFICGKNVYNQFEDCQDAGFFVSDDEIIQVIGLPLERTGTVMPILACKDRTIKILEKAKLKFSINLDGQPSALGLMNGDGGEHGTDIIYGTSDGKIGLLTITSTEEFCRWTHDTETNAGVTCMDFYDLTSDGIKEMILGFDDGTIQVYSMDREDYQLVPPRLISTQSCNESITGVQGGVFGNENFEEVVAVTYSGWVIGLTTESIDKKVSVDDGSYTISGETKQKLMKLKNEIDTLQGKVSQERDRYHALTQNSSNGYSYVPQFVVNDKLILNREDASYLMTLEVESPIDTILIQSDVPVDLLDVEKNSAVVSYSDCDPDSGNYLLVTFRCQANTTRIEVRLRTIEGQQGIVRAYITPRIQPKCCKLRTFRIKPLSLHVRAHGFDPNRPYNTLSINGRFSVGEIHSWLSNCIPEMPDREPSTGEASITFLSAFLDTMLHCDYRKGSAEFKSDNVSTISILKDWITKEATLKKIHLDIECDFNEESVVHTLQLIRPKLDGFLMLSKQVALIEALKEIQAQDPEFEQVLSSDYSYILNNAEKLRAAHKRQPNYLDRLYGMITDLYIDKHKYNGVNVKHRVPLLMDILDKQDFESLVDFFHTPIHVTHESNEY